MPGAFLLYQGEPVKAFRHRSAADRPDYVELAKLPDRYIHAPSEAPADVLENAGIVLGDSYPHPMVEHAAARAAALAGYDRVKAHTD